MMEENRLNLINSYLKRQLCMDFKLYHIGGSAIEILGYWKENKGNKIKILFNQPYMVLCTFSFSYKGNGDFISLATNDEVLELNKKYGIIKGNNIYRVFNTDINDVMYIVAKDIEVQIMDEIK